MHYRGKGSPLILIFIGGIMSLIIIIATVAEYNKYKNLEEVSGTYQCENCHEVTEGSGKHKRTYTACDCEYQFVYQDDEYTVAFNGIRKPETNKRYVKPEDPWITYPPPGPMSEKLIVLGFCLAFVMAGVYFHKRRQEEY